jgi:hypothetical protein
MLFPGSPGPPIQRYSGMGTVKLGTIVVPRGGAVLEWHCPACSDLEPFDISNDPNDFSQLDDLSMSVGVFEEHPTRGANNSVQAGAYHDVTADPLDSVAWSFTLTPKD